MKSSSILSAALVSGAAVLLVVASASCGSSRADCSPASCTGCCDSNHECQPGFLNDACGVNGAACVTCVSPQACGSGVCLGGSTGGNKDAGVCKGLGAGCLLNSECCSQSCDGTKCISNGGTDGGACQATGSACAMGSQCCSGSCANNVCAAAGGDGGTPDGGGTPSCSNITGDRPTQVCLRWSCDRNDTSEGTWTGDVMSCNPGDNPENRTKAVKLVNMYRFLAQLPEVTDDATRDQKAQQCALMMHANNTLSHTPPSTWTCYSADGAQAAGSSDISSTPGVSAIDLYMTDYGNDTTLGHRRWILSPGLGPIGSGTTSQYSCLWVIGGSGSATRPYVAWPPPGAFPIEAFTPPLAFGTSVNDTGWSIQSDAINLSSAIVTVTDLTSGSALPITVTQLLGGYGSQYAVSLKPMGWSPQAGHSYQVMVTGVSSPFSYQVDVVACP